ncbi:MAG TPA: hypothetical protein VII74_04835 [Chthoniobacterales bacterium]
MSEEEPKQDESPEKPPRPSRRQQMTPELRRFLNKPRPPGPETEAATPAPEKAAAPTEPDTNKPAAPQAPSEKGQLPNEKAERRAANPISQAEKASRAIEIQHAALIISALVLLGLAFYGGTKLNYLRYLIAAHRQPTLEETKADHFPRVPAAELITQALVAERNDQWQDAVARFMAAKRKDLRAPGILYRVGSILYDHGQLVAADKAFGHAIDFGENIEMANFYRGLIALRRKDYPAGLQFFQAAVAAGPFVAEYQYYCGEACRMDLQPKPAIPYYQRAALLASSETEATVCEFKIRLARLEAAETPAVSDELARKAAAGPLPVDWLLTAAAIDVRGGQIGAAREAISQAREAKAPGLFNSCVSDMYMRSVAGRFPELADVLRPGVDLQAPFPK